MGKSNNKLLSPSFYLILVPALLFGYLAIISLLAPILEEYYSYSISNYFYKLLSNICHQYPSRSLWIMKRPMGLCSRCFAIYASFSICLIVLPLLRNRKHIVLSCFLFLPLILDGLLQYYHIRQSDNFIRVLSGVLFGVAASTVYKYFTFDLVNNLTIIIKRKAIQNVYRYFNTVIESGLVFFTNLYALIVVF
jgi:uncharacterized membrane protein